MRAAERKAQEEEELGAAGARDRRGSAQCMAQKASLAMVASLSRQQTSRQAQRMATREDPTQIAEPKGRLGKVRRAVKDMLTRMRELARDEMTIVNLVLGATTEGLTQMQVRAVRIQPPRPYAAISCSIHICIPTSLTAATQAMPAGRPDLLHQPHARTRHLCSAALPHRRRCGRRRCHWWRQAQEARRRFGFRLAVECLQRGMLRGDGHTAPLYNPLVSL